MSRTAEQKTNHLGFPKPGELIEMTGTHALEASDRAILNLLYQHAHDSGKLLEQNAEWEIPLATVRQAFSRHESSDRLRDSLTRLMSVKVNVAYVAETGDGIEGPEQRVVITGLFDFFDVSAKELAKRATLRYGLPRKLAPILESSGRWGRIKAEIVCSMTSKYAIALYELIQLRANMEKAVETFPIDRFRELLGVPPGTYVRGDNFQRKVLDPAVLEVNGLSDMSLQIELERLHSRAPIHAVTLGWWRKSGDEFRAAMQERGRSKVGRMARLRGQVEIAHALATELPSSPLQTKIEATVEAMRQAGAPEADIEAFKKEQAA
ncbi:replication initiation protein [Paludibaculum fermentans]|uniref:replication initiation protein n=1 Tax=Paludibaculum fermentans TaxID=1473598 RepID=UPI003EB739F5